eukprot:Em0005g50a
METTMSRGLEQFDPTVERIDDYKERFDYYCVANGVGNDRKKALFLTKIGQKMFSNLKVWVSPTALSDLSLDDIVTRLRARTVPETIEIAERYRFFKRVQKSEENVIEYMSNLRALAKTCNFGDYLDTALRDQFVCGLQDSRIQRELLCIRDLSLAQAQDKARSMEIVLKETVELRQKEPDVSVEAGNDEGTSETHKISKSQGPRKGCPRCGGTNHMAANCFHKDKECNHCGKVGHLARVCRSGAGGKSKPMWKKSKDAMRAHMVQAEEREDSGSFEDEEKETDDEMYVHKISTNARYKKLVTVLQVNGVGLKFEVDTGAELSLILLKVYKERLSMVKVLPSSVVLKLYDGSILPTRGKVVVEAMQGRHRATGEFVIVQNADFQLPLLGRDWLGKLRLDWQGLLKSYVVKEGLGRLKGIRADIELKGKVKPIFCKSRAVPFALRKQVEEILQQQVEDGELQPVEQTVGVGACLMHVIRGCEQPVMYASRSLSTAESKYSQIEREALAIIFAVKKFHQYLYGKEFVLVTDHKPLCKLFGHADGIPTLAAARIQRWALILSAYQYRIEYVPGSENYCADCMSRLPLSTCLDDDKEMDILAIESCTLPVTALHIAKATRRDKTLATVLQCVLHGQWNLIGQGKDPFYRRREELSCHDGCVLWGQRVVIPSNLQSLLLEELHEGHLGVVRMKELARSYVWWPNLDQDIERMVASCEKCKMVSSMPQLAPHHPWQFPSSPWDRVHIDYGEYKGTHFFVLVDAYSKWPEVREMSTTTTQRTVEVLQEIFAMHGLPRILVSDNGPQFSSAEFKAFLAKNNIVHRTSAPYHPATNGLAENMVKNVKQWLSKQTKRFKFSMVLSDFLRTYRNVPHTVTKRTPAHVIFGRAPRTHLSMVLPNMSERVRQKSNPLRMDKLRTFAIGDRVWVRDFRPSAEHRWVQGEVTAKIGMMCYQVILSDGHKRKVHVDHLKHHVLSMPVETEIPEGEPTLQPSTSHNPVGTTNLRDEDTNGIIEQQSQHRNQPSTATVREESRDRIETSQFTDQQPSQSIPVATPAWVPELPIVPVTSVGRGVEELPCRRSTRVHKAPKRFIDEVF